MFFIDANIKNGEELLKYSPFIPNFAFTKTHWSFYSWKQQLTTPPSSKPTGASSAA